MKQLFALLAAVGIVAFSLPALAADKSDAKAELQELVAKVKAKLQQGEPTEEKLADEFKQFDALLAKHKGEQTDDVARILIMKAMLYF